MQGAFTENSLGLGEFSLFLNANHNNALPKAEVYVSPTGNDTSGNGTVNSPYATLAKAANKIHQMLGGKADGGVINLLAGTYNNLGGFSATTSTRYITVKPAPGLTKNNVIINALGGGSNGAVTNLVRFKDVTIKTRISDDGANTRTIFLDNVLLSGDAPTDKIVFLQGGSNWKRGAFTINSEIRLSGNALGRSEFVRNTYIHDIHADAFKNPLFIVNVRIERQLNFFNCDATVPGCPHRDIFQWQWDSPSPEKRNIIIYGVDATKEIQAKVTQTKDTDTGKLMVVNNVAFINSAFHVAGGTSNWAYTTNHFLMHHVTHSLNFFNPTQMQNISIRNSIFKRIVSSSLTGEIVNNHIIDPGAGATGASFTTGDPGFVDFNNGDVHPDPEKGSKLLGNNRPVPTDVPILFDMDEKSRPTDGSAAIGALEPISDSSRALVPGNGWSSPTPQPSDTGPALNTIARWDVVPLQTFDNKFEIGVIAFHKSGIDRVEFSVDNGPWTAITEMTLNPRTNVWEYWTTLDASLFSSDKKVEVRAIAYPKSGTPRVLQGDFDPHVENSRIRGEHSLFLYANAQGTFDEVIRWASPAGTDVNGCGTSQGNACRTILKASQEIAAQKGNLEGGVVYLTAGDYAYSLSTAANAGTKNRWVVVSGAPGTNKEHVRITSHLLNQGLTSKLALKNLTVFATHILGDQSTSDRKMIWINNVVVDGGDYLNTSTGFPISGHAWQGGVYSTDVEMKRMSSAYREADLIRNTQIHEISDDMFRENSGLVVNVTASKLLNVTAAHNDFVQWYTGSRCNDKIDNDGDGFIDWPNDPQCASRGDDDEGPAYTKSHDDFENVIFYNVKCADDCGGQALFVSTNQDIHRDWAFVNFFAETGPSGSVMSFSDRIDNLLLWNFGLIRKFPIDHQTSLMQIGKSVSNLDIRNSYFHRFLIHPSSINALDASRYDGWMFNGHFVYPGLKDGSPATVIPLNPDITKSYASYVSGDSNPADLSAKYNLLFVNHIGKDYRPAAGSILIGSNRPVPTEILVPIDVDGKLRPSDGSASIGPYEP